MSMKFGTNEHNDLVIQVNEPTLGRLSQIFSSLKLQDPNALIAKKNKCTPSNPWKGAPSNPSASWASQHNKNIKIAYMPNQIYNNMEYHLISRSDELGHGVECGHECTHQL